MVLEPSAAPAAIIYPAKSTKEVCSRVGFSLESTLTTVGVYHHEPTTKVVD
jgi:hypothetical protein